MALRVTNTTKGKVIGVGKEVILPGESKVIPEEYAKNPILDYYKDKGFIRTAKVEDKTGSARKGGRGQGSTASKEETPDDAETGDADEALRKARLASLRGITDEDLGKLAMDVGINPADCTNIADMKRKVREALKA